jgi:hypothetical protein
MGIHYRAKFVDVASCLLYRNMFAYVEGCMWREIEDTIILFPCKNPLGLKQ